MLVRPLAAVGLMSALAGCFPYPITVLPDVTGIVVDEITQEPLANIQVRVVTPNPDADPARFETTSGPNGRFHLPGKRQWGAHSLPVENWPRRYLISVAAWGYETATVEVTTKPIGATHLALGIIRLRKIAEPGA